MKKGIREIAVILLTSIALSSCSLTETKNPSTITHDTVGVVNVWYNGEIIDTAPIIENQTEYTIGLGEYIENDDGEEEENTFFFRVWSCDERNIVISTEDDVRFHSVETLNTSDNQFFTITRGQIYMTDEIEGLYLIYSDEMQSSEITELAFNTVDSYMMSVNFDEYYYMDAFDVDEPDLTNNITFWFADMHNVTVVDSVSVIFMHFANKDVTSQAYEYYYDLVPGIVYDNSAEGNWRILAPYENGVLFFWGNYMLSIASVSEEENENLLVSRGLPPTIIIRHLLPLLNGQTPK